MRYKNIHRLLIHATRCLVAVLFIILACCACQSTSPAPPVGTQLIETPSPRNTAIVEEQTDPATPEMAVTSIITWIRKFEGPDYGAFFDIILTGDGNALAVGATNHLHVPPYSGDALFVKLTLAGEVLWERTWGGDKYEQAWSVTQADDGGYYIFGETDSYGAGDRDFFLLKITADGTEAWYRTYAGERREWTYGMLPLSNGDLFIYGFSESLVRGERNQYALRVGQQGAVVWEYSVESSEEEFIIDALETKEGDLVLAVGIAENGKLVKLDAHGQTEWEKRYKLAGWQYASRITKTEDGGFFLAGFSMNPNGYADIWLAHCTATGEREWEKAFGDLNRDDYATSLIRLRDGTICSVGSQTGCCLVGWIRTECTMDALPGGTCCLRFPGTHRT